MKNSYYWLAMALIIACFSMSLPAQEAPSVPTVPRNFALQYVIKGYTPEIENSLIFFVDSVLQAGDQFLLITPAKIYSYPAEKWSALTAEQLKTELIARLRSDTEIAGSEFKSIYDDMFSVVLNMKPSPMKENDVSTEEDAAAALSRYRALTSNLAKVTAFNAPLYMKIAAVFKNQPNRNCMIVFLEQILLPVADEQTISRYSGSETGRSMIEVFRFKHEKGIDVKQVEDALNDSKIRLDLVYCSTKRSSRRDVDYKEGALSVYDAYRKIAKATGGDVLATSNPAHQLQDIIAALDNSSAKSRN